MVMGSFLYCFGINPDILHSPLALVCNIMYSIYRVRMRIQIRIHSDIQVFFFNG